MTLKEAKSVLFTIEYLNKELANFIYPYLKKEYENRYGKKAIFNVEDIKGISYLNLEDEDKEYVTIVFADTIDSADVIDINLEDIK